jgi:hypothetical protein
MQERLHDKNSYVINRNSNNTTNNTEQRMVGIKKLRLKKNSDRHRENATIKETREKTKDEGMKQMSAFPAIQYQWYKR